MPDPLAVDDRGNELLRFIVGAESDIDVIEPSVPLPLALVVAEDAGECLLVFNRWRQAWELPGGMLHTAESAREAAAHEFAEETGLSLDRLQYVGIAVFRLAPDARCERAAVFRCFVGASARDQLSSFTSNEEIERVCWWRPDVTLPGISRPRCRTGTPRHRRRAVAGAHAGVGARLRTRSERRPTMRCVARRTRREPTAALSGGGLERSQYRGTRPGHQIDALARRPR